MVAVLLLVGLAVVPPAEASPPCECSYLDSVFPPATRDLPTNVRFLVAGGSGIDLATLRLAKAMDVGHPVAVRIEAAGDAAGSQWVIPEAELTPETAYILQADGESPLGHPFQTGAGPDSGNPTLGDVTITPQEMSGACGEHQSALVETTGLADDLAPEGSVLLRLEVTDPAAGAWGPRTVFLSHGDAFVGGEMFVGTSDWEPECLGNLPGTASDHTYRARAVALDWAGNESAESGPLDFEMVWSPGMDWACGCRAPGAQRAPAGLLLAGLLAGVLLFRRRRG
jgi:hypothetical protein